MCMKQQQNPKKGWSYLNSDIETDTKPMNVEKKNTRNQIRLIRIQEVRKYNKFEEKKEWTSFKSIVSSGYNFFGM